MPTEILAVLISIIVHEIGHIMMFPVCRVKLGGFRLTPAEARLNAVGFISYEKEIMISAGGPALNLALAGIAMQLPSSDFSNSFITSSLLLAALNLIPINEFDGGRILSSTLGSIASERTQKIVCETADILGILVLWIISVYFMIKTASGVSLFFFSLMLLGKSK